MPGPANEKGRKKRLTKKQKTKKNESNQTTTNPLAQLEAHVQTPPESVSRVDERILIQNEEPTPRGDSRRTYTPFSHSRDDRIDEPSTPMEYGYPEDDDDNVSVYDPDAKVSHLEASSSYIYDPGNGPRVRDFMAFLKSPFAAPATQSFLHVGAEPHVKHQEERYTAANIIPILNRFLPGEFATILWFNRTRKTQRICPACQRLYHLADDLPALIMPAEGETPEADPEGVSRERELSGICAFPCFALATYNFGPGAVWAYGLTILQLDEDTLDAIESEGSGIDDQGLSTYVRMTRYDGHGLLELLSSAVVPR